MPTTNRRLRRVSAIVSFFSFIVMGVSGLVMFFWPGTGHRPLPGAVQTAVFGLDRHFWSEAHEITAIVFLVAALIHLILNWKPMSRHLGFGTAAPSPIQRDYL